MSSLPVELAIYERLTGAPLDSQGRPQRDPNTGIPVNRTVIAPPNGGDPGLLPSYGIRIPMAKNPTRANRGQTNRDPDALRLFGDGWDKSGYRQIPVFDQNIEGRKWQDVWPCVTFKLTDERAQPATYIYYDDFSAFDTTSTAVAIKNAAGETIQTGYSSKLNRPHPESYDYYYTITAYSKSSAEMAWIQNQIKYLFKQKGAILVEQADGSVLPFDTMLESTRFDDTGDVPMAADGDEFRVFKRSYVYRVEGYFDNTVNGFGVQDITTISSLVQQRILDLADLQGVLLEHAGDLNLQELAAI